MNTPQQRVGLLTGGGDCPGLNAVIRAVTQCLIRQCNAEVIGIQDGFAGLMESRTVPLSWERVDDLLALGGTVLGTTNRLNPLNSPDGVARAMYNAQALGLDALVAIGGDGTLTIAHALAERGLHVVGVPKTIDNDIEGCERSFGFDTAVATVTDALERVHTTGQSHGRIMILETMGRHAGWIALEAGIAGAADIILLPEIDHDIGALAAVCREREARHDFTLICMGEGAKANDGGITYDTPAPGDAGKPRLGGAAKSAPRCSAMCSEVAARRRSTVYWPHVTACTRPIWWRKVISGTWSRCATANSPPSGWTAWRRKTA